MFRMTVEDTFHITGRGLVATGRVEAGTLRAGDEVQVNGGPAVRVEAIEKLRKVLDEAAEGDNVGLLLKGATGEAVKRGDVLTTGAGMADLAPPSPDVAQRHDAANRALGRD